jgi:hypothetical protein
MKKKKEIKTRNVHVNSAQPDTELHLAYVSKAADRMAATAAHDVKEYNIISGSQTQFD